MIFECHITVSTAHAKQAEAVAESNHWKTSEIARDPVLGKDTFFYLTKHADEYQNLYGHMKMTVGDLQRIGIPILREKIELIMHDTKAKK